MSAASMRRATVGSSVCLPTTVASASCGRRWRPSWSRRTGIPSTPSITSAPKRSCVPRPNGCRRTGRDAGLDLAVDPAGLADPIDRNRELLGEGQSRGGSGRVGRLDVPSRSGSFALTTVLFTHTSRAIRHSSFLAESLPDAVPRKRGPRRSVARDGVWLPSRNRIRYLAVWPEICFNLCRSAIANTQPED